MGVGLAMKFDGQRKAQTRQRPARSKQLLPSAPGEPKPASAPAARAQKPSAADRRGKQKTAGRVDSDRQLLHAILEGAVSREEALVRARVDAAQAKTEANSELEHKREARREEKKRKREAALDAVRNESKLKSQAARKEADWDRKRVALIRFAPEEGQEQQDEQRRGKGPGSNGPARAQPHARKTAGSKKR
ncbi:hypothetical protein FVE85_7332 [Porphyridium purpureum]|uniref:Uncharacterized protein n=1 Tax=Porphyridium purpureum TaxID=35688 RepID=A0A5J4ZAU1_PORPP|nr:hypothetical protein FVE85_7332 [Porphyridium purpureum]|eukprot:POR4044..scf295_1